MSHAPTGGNPVLRDQGRHARVVGNQLLEVAEVIGWTLGRSRPAIRRIEPDEVGVVRIDVIAGEPACRVDARGPDKVGIQCDRIVLELQRLAFRWSTHALPPERLFGGRGLGTMSERVQRRPVGVGDRSESVVRVDLVGKHRVTLLGQPQVHSRCMLCRKEASGVGALGLPAAVEGLHGMRLPLSTDDVSQGPGGDVRVVAAAGVPGPARESGRTVDHIHHATHFPPKLALPTGLGEVVTWRQFGPYAMDQPEGFAGVAEIERPERPVETGWKDGVYPERVRMHRGQGVKTSRVARRVSWKLRWIAARECRPEVDASHVERPPGSAREYLESPAVGPGREL